MDSCSRDEFPVVTMSLGLLPKTSSTGLFPPYVTMEFLTAAAFFSATLLLLPVLVQVKSQSEHRDRGELP